jgi:hypothetical protein
MGNRGVIKAGDVQRMSTGTGLTHSEHNLRPLQNAPFCPISVSSSNFARSEALALSSKYSMYSCLPRRSGRSYGVVKIFAFLELEQN